MRVRFPGPGSARQASKHEQEIEGYRQQETRAPGGRKSGPQKGCAEESGGQAGPRQGRAEKAGREGRLESARKAGGKARGEIRGQASCEASVQTMDAYRFLDIYAGEAEFDLVFADPPYFKKDGDTDHASQLASSKKLHAALRPNALLVLEKQHGGPALPAELFEPVRSKRYGGSEIHFLAKR